MGWLMSAEIRIKYNKLEGRREDIDQWLRTNAGAGSARFGGREGTIRHWLNGDDWLYYSEFAQAEDQLAETDVVFLFKDERIATEFTLRFA
jgi:hypothetical protein